MYVSGYKCKLCDFETAKKGWRVGQIEIEKHLQEKHEIHENRGESVTGIKPKPRKLWKCPHCATEPLPYSSKQWHIDNWHSKTLPRKMLKQNENAKDK